MKASLANAVRRRWLRVERIALAEGEAAWLRALGICEHEVAMVLRRAPFAGPLHIRLKSGAEFALDVRLASRVEVEDEVGSAQLDKVA